MSAFIVSNAHIDTLVDAAARSDYGEPWYYWHKNSRHEVVWDKDRTGQMLLDENFRSVNARYDENTVPERYAWKPARPVSPVQLLKALDCFEYQACETDDYYESEAHSFCAALRRRTIRSLPGYEEAYWGVPADAPADA